LFASIAQKKMMKLVSVLSSVLAGASAFAPASFDRAPTHLSATRAINTKKKPATKVAPETKKDDSSPFSFFTQAIDSVKKPEVTKAAPVGAKKAAPMKAAPMKAVAVATKKAPPAGKKNISFNTTPNDTGLIGALDPIGFFDPAGFASRASPEELLRYREVEIMHGRFAQLAVIGILAVEKYAADGSFGDDFLAPTGTALEVFSEYPLWTGLTFGVIAILETVRLLETEPGARANALILETGLYKNPGDEKLADYALKELQNGRLAMMAFAGEIAQELVNQTPLLENLSLN
jgi:hypothetical protein